MRSKRRLRWFTAQFLIIVAGVLVALAVDSWRSRAARKEIEQFYIAQLLSDIRATESSLERSSMFMDGTVRASVALLGAFRDPERASPDSVAKWIALVSWISTPHVNLRVADGLVSGNFGTIRSDSLRAALVSLLAKAETFRKDQDVSYKMFVDYTNRLREKTPVSERLAAQMRTDSVFVLRTYKRRPFADDLTTAFPTNYKALLRDRETFVIVDGMFDSTTDLFVQQRRMLDDLATLRKRLEGVQPE